MPMLIPVVIAYAGSAVGTMLGSYFIGYALTAAATYAYQSYQKRKAERASRDAYNASLTDRLAMVTLVDKARSRCYGRVRNVDGVVFKASHGENLGTYTLLVSLCGHAIDGLERIYFNDLPVILDEDGWVLTAPYRVNSPVSATEVFTLPAGAFSVALEHAPAGSMYAVVTSDYSGGMLVIPVSIAGNVISGTIDLSSMAAEAAGHPVTLTVQYQWTTGVTKARVRFYNAGEGGPLADLMADLPGLMRSTDRFDGMALLRVDLTYDTDAFVSGVPGVSAVFRGARVLDPRTGTLAWSENPAVCALDWARHQNGGRLTDDVIDVASFISAANACDISTTFTLSTGEEKVAPLYTCGIAIALDQDPMIGFNEMVEAMAGRSFWPGGRLRVRAGVYTAPVATITEDWLSGKEKIQIVPEPPLDEAVNVYVPTIANGQVVSEGDASGYVTGATYGEGATSLQLVGGTGTLPLAEYVRFGSSALFYELENGVTAAGQSITLVSPGLLELVPAGTAVVPLGPLKSAYVAAPTAEVRADAYIELDGQELSQDTTLSAVTDLWHAQHVCGVLMRDARNGLTATLPCNLRALPLDAGDVIAVDIPRFGFDDKEAEILDWSFSLGGGVTLKVKETAEEIFQVGAGFGLVDLTPNTSLPNPFDVPVIIGLTAVSGTDQLLLQSDGTIVPRVLVTWDAVQDEAVRKATRDGIVVRYGRADQLAVQWESVSAPGDATQVYLTGLQDGAYYVITAYARNSLVTGVECPALLHYVIGKTAPPGDVTGFTSSPGTMGVQFSWEPLADVDYKETEVRIGTVTQTWGSDGMTFLRVAGSTVTWIAPDAGTYRAWARHRDSSGNESMTTVFVDFTVTEELALEWDNIVGRPKLFRVVAHGFGVPTAIMPGLWDAEANVMITGAVRSYILARLRRSDGALLYSAGYDVIGLGAATGGKDADDLAADLNASGSDTIVVVYTDDEPQTNRLTPALYSAMLRCGASRAVFGSPQFQYRSAYCLIGIGGCGEGNGFESYQGAVAGDPNAQIDVAFQLQYSQLLVTGMGATPRTLADYSYVGDLNATNGATFGVNISGQAKWSDIEPGAVCDVLPLTVAGPVGTTVAAEVARITFGPYPFDCKITATATFSTNIVPTSGGAVQRAWEQYYFDSSVGGASPLYNSPIITDLTAGSFGCTISATFDYFANTTAWVRLVAGGQGVISSTSVSDVRMRVEVIKR